MLKNHQQVNLCRTRLLRSMVLKEGSSFATMIFVSPLSLVSAPLVSHDLQEFTMDYLGIDGTMQDLLTCLKLIFMTGKSNI